MKRLKILFICILLLYGMIDNLFAQEHISAVHDYIGIYQKYISGMNHSQCLMYPSCSRYGMMVFEDYSFPVAMTLMADRMLRCGNHPDFYIPYAGITGSNRMLDFPASRQTHAKTFAHGTHNVAAETIIPVDSVSKAIQFINSLVNHQYYASALLEINRLLYNDTSFYFNPNLYINAMRCFDGQLKYSEGLMFFEQRVPEKLKLNYKVLYTAAHLYDLVEDNDKSIALFQKSASIWDSNDVHPFGELAILYSKEKQYDAAKLSVWQKYIIDSNETAHTTSVSIIEKLATTKYKNSTTAMLLGLIPGAGYLYAKQPGSALTSLLTNTLLAYATYTSFKSENYGLGIIMGLFSASFYIGNIAGSGNSALRYNEKTQRDAINELRTVNPFFY